MKCTIFWYLFNENIIKLELKSFYKLILLRLKRPNWSIGYSFIGIQVQIQCKSGLSKIYIF